MAKAPAPARQMGEMEKTMPRKATQASDEFTYALDMVALFSRMNLLLVPRAPTSAMIDAGVAVGNVSAEDVARIYAAMTASEA